MRREADDSKFTVCVLLYGDYLSLAMRCLESLRPLKDVVDLRIGLNEVDYVVEDYVRKTFPDAKVSENYKPQIFKYPMMRKLFYETGPLKEYVMWFDDDSYVKEIDKLAWLRAVESNMPQCDMLGSTYSISYTEDQKAWAKTQPWFNNKPLSDKPKFATGGWWCIKSALLAKHNWPVPELKHSGGDVALGVLLNQQGYSLKHFNRGVAINADSSGKESAAPRRGESGKEKPVGKGFIPR
jgi:hypothetical protein